MGEFDKYLDYLKGMEARNIAKKEFILKRIIISINYNNREEHVIELRNTKSEINGGGNSWLISFTKDKMLLNFKVNSGQSTIKNNKLEINYDQHHSIIVSSS